MRVTRGMTKTFKGKRKKYNEEKKNSLEEYNIENVKLEGCNVSTSLYDIV